MLGDADTVQRSIAIGGLILLVYLLASHWRSPLRQIPGPRLAAYTNLWRMRILWTGRTELEQIAVHRQYGPVVRLGPNMVSLANPAWIPIVYSATKPWAKSEMYAANDALVDGVPRANIFSTRDMAWHASMVKPLRRMVTITKTVPACETPVDESIRLLCSKMDEKAARGESVSLQQWLMYFSHDCLHNMTFGAPRGCLETSSDVGNFIKDAYGGVAYFGWMPFLDKLLVKNPLLQPFLGEPPFVWAFKQSYERLAARKAQHDKSGTTPETHTADLLDLFLASRSVYPDIVTDDHAVINYVVLNLLAGSDTVFVSLTATIYHLYRNPSVLEKLRKELDAAGWGGSVPIPYNAGSKLPYLDAIIHEGLRIHPAVGFVLERVVPPEGWAVPDSSLFVPGGTKIGMNAWVSNRDESIYGPEDVDAFEPARWMQRANETTEAWEKRNKRMKNLMLTFGYGNRICTGKSVAMVELVKTVGTFAARYEIEFLNKSWTTYNHWFVYPYEFNIKITRREGVSDHTM